MPLPSPPPPIFRILSEEHFEIQQNPDLDLPVGCNSLERNGGGEGQARSCECSFTNGTSGEQNLTTPLPKSVAQPGHGLQREAGTLCRGSVLPGLKTACLNSLPSRSCSLLPNHPTAKAASASVLKDSQGLPPPCPRKEWPTSWHSCRKRCSSRWAWSCSIHSCAISRFRWLLWRKGGGGGGWDCHQVGKAQRRGKSLLHSLSKAPSWHPAPSV